jgi:cell division protein FtsW (lipid II flippase)
MGATYTTAAQRDAQPASSRDRRVDPLDLLLVATSVVVALAIMLAYAGRSSLFDMSERARRDGAVVDLNLVADPGPLDPALAAVITNPNDRRAVASELFRFLADERSRGRELPNVGAIARADTALTGEQGAGHTGPLLSAADVAALKPHFVVRTRRELRTQLLLFSLVYVLGFHALAVLWRLRGIQGDWLLLSVAHLLTGIGFAVLVSRSDPLRDSLLFVRYAEATAVGLTVMGALSFVDFTDPRLADLSYVPLAGALSLSLLLVVFGSGPGASTAKVNLGPVQPVEATRLLLALFLAGYFARRWELLRVRGRTIRDRALPAWVNMPRADYFLPVVVGVGAALAFFFLQRDLGPALLLCCVFLAIYAVARGRTGMAIIGLGLLVLGFYVGYRLHVSNTLAARVRMWQSPWDNALAGGDQVAHAMWALASGGSLGTGLGLGDTRYLPAGHTDLVLAAIGEELGAVGLVLVAALYALVAFRGFRIARRASSDYGFFLAAVLTLFLIVPVLLMASGILGVTPLTGVVTPFLSYGGSAMVANFAALGILASLRRAAHVTHDSAPFSVPMKCLGAALGVCALTLIGFLVNVQIVRADDVVMRAHLGIQADGGRRFEYNPRVVDVVRQLPRGSVYDRRRVPLATDDPRVVAQARQTYERMGISMADACPRPDERCYPLGGRAFHLLGDVRTRVNWSAPNTSYVERDAENRLRGFDDHAAVVHTMDSSGRLMTTLRRDYRDLLPAFRHRYQPNDPAVAALRNQPRDVTLTIDANFQFRVSEIIAAYAKKAGTRAAAVVVDPDSGDLLASASYPWTGASDGEGSDPADPLLDRARYGLYPPGSTFKLVTAAAALRQNSSLTQTTFMCARLPDGRVGATVRGWNRPIRDDVLDTHPHGTIDMHDAMVHSCNAYFGQLALKLGPAPLVETAGKLGISLTPSSNVLRRVADTLPQVGYGQADVVATPLRMVRLAAAAASNGVLRETRWVQSSSPSKTEPFLDAAAARVLAGYMRDVVVAGTGRRLRDHPWRIAGKTGTAELSGKPSHSWFVGFAPYGAATRRIAFAIIIENAGYGAASAAPAAGEIVTAAAAAGLIK